MSKETSPSSEIAIPVRFKVTELLLKNEVSNWSKTFKSVIWNTDSLSISCAIFTSDTSATVIPFISIEALTIYTFSLPIKFEN